MVRNFLNETPFLLKIATLFFILWLGMVSQKFVGDEKREKNLTFIEKANIAYHHKLTSIQK